MTSPPTDVDRTADSPAPDRERGLDPLGRLLDLFSSVKLGIVLLVILFVYSSIGSAGVVYPDGNPLRREGWAHDQLRQWRGLEMTEFEWFHWWPFNLLIALICANIIVTTIRRIRFNVVNLGVWTIHTGILVLAIGSLIYFGTKVEGDAPVARRQVILEVQGPDGPIRTSMLAMPGNRTALVTPAGPWEFEITSIDPSWELLSGDDEGARAYSVNVMVAAPEGGRFIRQVLAGYPEYTEDLIFTNDRTQPFKRAVKETGEAIIEPALAVSLVYAPATQFYFKNNAMKSWALYVRRPGDSEWVQRPINGLPLYNDYIADRADVLQMPGDRLLPVDPIDVPIPAASSDDPFPDVELRATGYLRYAQMRTQFLRGGPEAPLNPMVWGSVSDASGARRDFRLAAFDRQRRFDDGGEIAFRWIETPGDLEKLLEAPTLRFEVPEASFEIELPITDVAAANPDLAMTPLGETGYSYRVVSVQDDVPLSSGEVSLSILEIEGPSGPFRRWVFSNPDLTRDVTEDVGAMPHQGGAMIDDGLIVSYMPGSGGALLTVVAGPGDDSLGLVTSFADGASFRAVTPGTPIELGGSLTFVIDEYMDRASVVPRPLVIPLERRERGVDEFFSLARIEAPNPSRVSYSGGTPWLRYHRYVFDDERDALLRYDYDPTTMTLADGRRMEVMFSRTRRQLPEPVVLDEFILSTHPGGFSGSTMEIRDYTSVLRFGDGAGGYGEPVRVSVNDPVTVDGLSYFQAQWDPPIEARAQGDRASAGLNYTVLGVGNRNGVMIQLAGCIIAVLGMIYAFYVKPVIKRRRQQAVLARVGAMQADGTGAAPAATPSREPAEVSR